MALTYYAIYMKYLSFHDSDRGIIEITGNNSQTRMFNQLSLLSVQNNVLQILARNKHFIPLSKGIDVLIKYSPYIEWIDDENNQDANDVVTNVTVKANTSYGNVLHTKKYVQKTLYD